MTRSSQVLVENNFTRGLITEATAMAFPENAVVEIDNCVISTRGVVTRRYGMDYENNFTVTATSTITANTGAYQEYEWTAVANNGSLSFIVQQLANKIVFFQVDATTGISDNKKAFEIDLLTYKVAAWTNANVYETPCSFTSGAGFLYITNAFCEPLSIEYDFDTDSITTTPIVVKIRDIGGVDDGLDPDERPSTLSANHNYNLLNQGWGTITAVTTTTWGDPIPALDYWENARADYPSNAEQFWVYRNTTSDLAVERVDEIAVGNSLAPKGYYIFNAFDVDRDSIVATVENATTDSRPNSVAFYAGRVWYSGVSDSQYSSRLYFSRIVTSKQDVGLCYQKNDPTAENSFEILDDDGGVIVIAEAGVIKQVISSNNSLLVFANNGVWSVSGSDNTPFSPTNYSVTRISDIGTVGVLPSCSVEGFPVWITNEGIYTIAISEVSRSPSVVGVTKDTIQSLFDAIPKDNLPFIKGVYNSVERRVLWLYRSTVATTVAEYYQYDKVLIFDKTSNAFYQHTLVTSLAPKVSGVVVVDGINDEGRKSTVFKFVTTGAIGSAGVSGITFSQMTDDNHLDWVSYNTTGSPYTSYFITGYRVRGELLKKFQSNYLMVLTADEPDGSCLVQGLWDYTNTTSNGRYTTSQEVYRPDSTYNYHRCKLKIRGNGYSLQFKFRSNGNAPFQIIGWATFETANNVP